MKIARFNSTKLGIKVQKLETWAFVAKTSIQLNEKLIVRKFLKAWKLFQNTLKCVKSDALKYLGLKMDEILIHVSSEIAFSFLKNHTQFCLRRYAANDKIFKLFFLHPFLASTIYNNTIKNKFDIG